MNSSPQAASDERVSEPPVWGNTRSDERSGLNKNAGGEGEQEDKEHVYRYVPARGGSLARERQILEPGRNVPVHESVREPVEQ